MTPYWRIFGRLGNSMFQGAYLYAQARKGLLPDIYLQDEKFFDGYAEEIKVIYGSGIGYKSGYVSVHVRRGDYVDNSYYVDLFENGYYKRAMGFFPNKKFLVFSDEIDWCRQQEVFQGCEFSEGLDEIEDMNLMASCESNIIANSSYSWWAAFLNPNPEKIVIAPKNWYTLTSPTDGHEKISSTQLPADWITL